MQQIDRIKVYHAKDSFFNPENGRFLPSLDTAHASGSLDPINFTNQAMTPVPGMGVENQHSPVKDYLSMVSDQDVVTKHEIKDVCERFNTKPSDRQRIIIARTNQQVAKKFNSQSLSAHITRNNVNH